MAETTEQTPVRKAITSLADFGAVTFNVDVQDVDGAWFTFTLKALTPRQWSEVSNTIVWPKPPISGVDKNARPIPDENDPTYLAATRETAASLNFRLLAKALVMDIPGDTLAEKADALRDGLTAQVAERLISVLTARGENPEVSVAARAATFQPVGDAAP